MRARSKPIQMRDVRRFRVRQNVDGDGFECRYHMGLGMYFGEFERAYERIMARDDTDPQLKEELLPNPTMWWLENLEFPKWS